MAYITSSGGQEADNRVREKAIANGERTFTLRSQDMSSPRVIAEWIKENIETAPPQKLLDALEAAIEMRVWPSRKHPD